MWSKNIKSISTWDSKNGNRNTFVKSKRCIRENSNISTLDSDQKSDEDNETDLNIKDKNM